MAIDRDSPATRGDLEGLKVEVNTGFEAFDHRMEQFLSDMEGRIIASNYRLAESILSAHQAG